MNPGVFEIEAYEFGGGGGGNLTGNLIQNGDAESGAAGGFAGIPAIPGWTTDGNVAVVKYSDGDDGITAASPGPTNRGSNYFAGGPGNAASKITQTIDLSGSAAAIDGGSQPFTIDGWRGGYDGQNDNAILRVTFLSASGATLGSASIGPVLAADRGDTGGMIEKTTSGSVPAGTRKATVSLEFTRTDGSDNDGAADNLYFSLTGGGSTSPGTAITIFNTGVQAAGTLAADGSVDRIIS